MAQHEDVVDSPKAWVASHIKDYVETDGKKGHIWKGVPTLLLTTRGRKTGKRRRTALIYGQDGESYIVVASLGGAPNHPMWYLNLTDDPEVDIQVGAEQITGRARTADETERKRLWSLMAKIWPDYDKYQMKTRRRIPVVIIDRD